MNNKFNLNNQDIAWCPGCGNFSILETVKSALDELSIEPKNIVMVSGIGQAAKMPQYINSNFFNGLHGRALPVATAIKSANRDLTIIAESGEGDMYGEGGNHLIHAIRRNVNITNIVHNNMIYGLTKGQASPTTQKGMKTTLQVFGVVNEPFNPMAVAVSLGASFVARAFSGDKEQTKEIIKQAVLHKGYSIIDIFQPCVSFNKINNFKWFKDNCYYLGKDYDPYNQVEAFKKALETEKFPLGVLYINKDKDIPFEEKLVAYDTNKDPLFKKKRDLEKVKSLLKTMK
ncbi:MAG: thiamine pyrophosphate-dependent enzyme [Sphaerochaetaceae bacterium]|nr:thiamine pyrophosphate-dependent enzyme [Sphaerochaetaceae bacterium]MDC7236923.1 thiamine pyrophosphate-dependent enzyme [Sphaerochaetaceae bacterium]MDC7242920.1 thiamine pyrophosphate-dependent enzyme [Sphaerochaetaceae bacterium]MDC7251071.1 thiamine pyrophosphate-dependent enzyme [Sphaerochaetaceae bacterium]